MSIMTGGRSASGVARPGEGGALASLSRLKRGWRRPKDDTGAGEAAERALRGGSTGAWLTPVLIVAVVATLVLLFDAH